MMESFECDVLIVGAGLSGLSSAYFMVKKDESIRVVVLEAKDRLGGRTFTKQMASGDGSKDFWDFGGEWFGRPQLHAHYLLKKFDVNRFNPVSEADSKGASKHSWQIQLDLWQFKWKLASLKKKVKVLDSRNASPAVKWDDLLFCDYMQENLWTSDSKTIIENACHCMFGLMPSEMTLLFFLKNIDLAGGLDMLITPEQFIGGEFRIKGGTQQLSYHLFNKIGKENVLLNHPVTHIMQSSAGVRVTTSPGMHILCQRVIMAVPPHHAANIQYDPPLPSSKLELMQSIPLAFLIKFVITYETAFWRKDHGHLRQGFQAVLADPKLGQIGLAYEATSGRGNPALAGFISHADKIDPDSKNRKQLILSLIEEHLGPQCQHYLEFSQLDWSLEPYNGGCFLKNFIPETFRHFRSEIREPYDRIHFAGTETATVWCGFMNGAIQAGFRAGSEVLYHLRPLIPTSQYPQTGRKHMKCDNASGSYNWLGWLALGTGVATAAYFMVKTNRVSTSSDSFLRNVRLVFDPVK